MQHKRKKGRITTIISVHIVGLKGGYFCAAFGENIKLSAGECVDFFIFIFYFLFPTG